MGNECYQPLSSNYRLAITAQQYEMLSILRFLLVQDNNMILGI